MEETVRERTSEIELPMPETSPRTGERWTSTSAKHVSRFEMLTAPIARTAPTMSRWTRWSVMLAPTLGTGQVTSATWRRTCANGSTTTRATMPPRIDGPRLATDPTPLPTALPPQRSDHSAPANSNPRSRPPGPRPPLRGEPSRGSRGSQHTAATSSTCPHVVVRATAERLTTFCAISSCRRPASGRARRAPRARPRASLARRARRSRGRQPRVVPVGAMPWPRRPVR